jgi:hypothetical protein
LVGFQVSGVHPSSQNLGFWISGRHPNFAENVGYRVSGIPRVQSPGGITIHDATNGLSHYKAKVECMSCLTGLVENNHLNVRVVMRYYPRVASLL